MGLTVCYALKLENGDPGTVPEMLCQAALDLPVDAVGEIGANAQMAVAEHPEYPVLRLLADREPGTRIARIVHECQQWRGSKWIRGCGATLPRVYGSLWYLCPGHCCWMLWLTGGARPHRFTPGA